MNIAKIKVIQPARVAPLAVKNGHIAVPQGPGWGVEIKADWLRQAQCKSTG